MKMPGFLDKWIARELNKLARPTLKPYQNHGIYYKCCESIGRYAPLTAAVVPNHKQSHIVFMVNVYGGREWSAATGDFSNFLGFLNASIIIIYDHPYLWLGTTAAVSGA